jgi:hypothetical protein
MIQLISWIFSLILYLMGWNPIGQKTIDHIKANKNTICVFSHTSYWDFYIMAIYFLANPSMLGYFNVLIKPEPFRYAGWILRKLGGIPATKVTEKNGGSSSKIAEHLSEKPFGSVLLICPKGSIVKKPWRSGYYHIAQALNAPILACGLDYETKTVYASERIDSSLEEEKIREFLFKELTTIVPKNVDQEIVEIRQHDPSKVNVFNPPKIVKILPVLLLYSFCMFNLLLKCNN